MARRLPKFIFDVLPALYAGYRRVLSQSGLGTAELYGLFLLRSSEIEIDGHKALALSEFLESVTRGMGYSAASAATTALNELIDGGLAREMRLDAKRRLPGRGRRTVLLETAGEEKFQNICNSLDRASSEFLEQLPDSVAQDIEMLSAAAEMYKHVLPAMIRMFAHGPGPGNADSDALTEPEDELAPEIDQIRAETKAEATRKNPIEVELSAASESAVEDISGEHSAESYQQMLPGIAEMLGPSSGGAPGSGVLTEVNKPEAESALSTPATANEVSEEGSVEASPSPQQEGLAPKEQQRATSEQLKNHEKSA